MMIVAVTDRFLVARAPPHACQKQWLVWISSVWNSIFPKLITETSTTATVGIWGTWTSQKIAVHLAKLRIYHTQSCSFHLSEELFPVPTSSRCKWCPPSSDRLCSPDTASLPRLLMDQTEMVWSDMATEAMAIILSATSDGTDGLYHRLSWADVVMVIRLIGVQNVPDLLQWSAKKNAPTVGIAGLWVQCNNIIIVCIMEYTLAREYQI